MLSPILTGAGLLLSTFVFFTLASFRRNLAAAKVSGLPYTFAPVYPLQSHWLLLQRLLVPLLSRLPTRWTDPWLPLSTQTRLWSSGHAPFRRLGHDAFIAVTAGRNVLWTCDAPANAQILSVPRRDDFPKPAALFTILKAFGLNLVASEGREARVYRRIIGPAFNDALHREVWSYSLEVAGEAVRRWDGVGGRVDDLAREMGEMALAVISSNCFGKKLEENLRPAPGHALSYRDALEVVVKGIVPIVSLPQWLLKWSPLESHRRTYRGYQEMRQYLTEMREEERRRIADESSDSKSFNLLGALVGSEKPDADQKVPTDDRDNLIPPSAVLGNVFLFVFAGHETTATALTFATTLLALRPDVQAALHDTVDRTGGGGPPAWTFERHFAAWLDGLLGAIMNETLRLYPAAAFIAKSTTTAQPLATSAGDVTVPAGSIVLVDVSATHTNPKYWGDAEEGPRPLAFDPLRWLEGGVGGGFRPAPGAWEGFSDGARSCIGRRFAQVEFVAVLARVFWEYCVQVAGAGDDRTGAGREAREGAVRELAENIGFDLTLKMRKGVRLRFVRRR